MKNKYERTYDRLYSISIEDFELCPDEIQNSFIFQGSGNWDMYCLQKTNGLEFDTYHNVELVGFDTLQELNAYQIAKDKIIDFSREHIHDPKPDNKFYLLLQR